MVAVNSFLSGDAIASLSVGSSELADLLATDRMAALPWIAGPLLLVSYLWGLPCSFCFLHYELFPPQPFAPTEQILL
jgi:hypothetical protein